MELPPGRKPVQTLHRYDKKRGALYQFIREQVKAGRQAYIVYPLIEKSETLDLKNLEEGFVHIREAFPEFAVCQMHGRMKPAEKEEVMRRFVPNEAQIMVSTTVALNVSDCRSFTSCGVGWGAAPTGRTVC